jgi:glycosidase
VPRTYRLPWTLRGPSRRFHVTIDARRRYGVDDELVTIRGDLMLVDVDACERLAAAVERERATGAPPLTAADLYAGAVLEEVYHLLIDHHRRTVDPALFATAAASVRERLGRAGEATLEAFVARYPNRDVAAGRRTPAAFLDDVIDDVPAGEAVLEEALTCFLANVNPALAGARPLVDDAPLRLETAYDAVLTTLRGTLAERPATVVGGGSLFDELLAPMRAAPDDLRAQLRFVRERWGGLLGGAFEGLLGVLLGAIDALEEVHRDRGGAGGPAGPGPGHARGLIRASEAFDERFSPDASWMPRVVLMAKNSYVWLDQLSRRYGREVRRLDQIPDEALAELAQRGVTGLWLIGLWERSPASRAIKVLRGQSDAVASAYALYDYVIAEDLGGEGAYERLRDAAARHGLRLASDMVPNHVGIDGRWVVEHPDWFVQLDHPPFPGYRFEGPELSTDARVSVKIEDRYFDGSDAAVVFQRRDTATGETRFIYHGNDGTAMPWNDTAQLDYLNPDVREAVIQTILAVARRFPIIRFDAAMTLARRHVRRLWYPEPGQGGAIPSRGRFGAMSDDAFDAAMPTEFWRDVVDRVAAEAPDTLLLAEAFWMMEGYFVRTLGMHRVYNSAFMHMTKNEDGRGYRALMKETLAFDPQILKRFVNFMNNPDEESARVQFGDGDKYFAVATLLATLPGLPMLGHGQFEGYREKYGMEFRAPRTDEQPDERLVARHEREVVPLLHRRAQFAEVERFRLYDVVDGDGHVLEDVYAYSNHAGGSGSLVLVNNRYPRSEGWLRTSVPFRGGDGGERRDSLAEALGVRGGHDRFVVMSDVVSGLHYLHRADDLLREGMPVSLDGYGRRVFVDVHERVDEAGVLARLARRLDGAGTPSLDAALEDLRLEPLHDAFAALLQVPPYEREGLQTAWERFIATGPVTLGARALAAPTRDAWRRLASVVSDDALAVAWALHCVSHAAWPHETWVRSALGRVVARRMAAESGSAVPTQFGSVALSAWSDAAEVWRDRGEAPDAVAWLRRALGDGGAGDALGVNEFEGVRWFRRESAMMLADVTFALMRLQRPGAAASNVAAGWRRRVHALIDASGYRVDGVVATASAGSGARTGRGRGGSRSSAKGSRAPGASRGRRRGRRSGGRSSG